jgi:hypothetical protein
VRDEVTELEGEVQLLAEFYKAYEAFDKARIHYEKAGQYRGDARAQAVRAWDHMQVVLRQVQARLDEKAKGKEVERG